ncbi:MAG: MaoC family dehydratase [Deltaproteobacteria bacterium]|jgi:acyl dehydratase|nr:MaoC family dehydratase [Deltaproteobacteria bacterium]MBW2385948.1 MaoC family dehydratase [Deltaproteobacteria bacterium]MBW2698997.1 MaoC family dehydratase [Deltaproteobacteria bacterium]
MTSERNRSKRSSEIAVGDELPPFDLPVTSTLIVAGAIASRDFMPAHHDREFAVAQGAPDMFMNILTTNGYVSRFITDWAGPESMVRRIAIRLGAPAIPGQPLRFSGQVAQTSRDGDECVIEVAVRAANELGDHATGTVVVSLPLA